MDNIEIFLENYLTVYYFLLFFCVGIFAFFNYPKEKRITQTTIPKLFIIYIVISTIILIANISFSDLQASSYINSPFLELAVILSGWFAEGYSKYTLWAIGIGAVLKSWIKFVDNSSFFFEAPASKQTGYVPSYAKNSGTNSQDKKEKKNFLVKIFYKEDNSVNEFGTMISKISRVIAISLMVAYIAIPILKHYDIEFLSSKVGLLLFIITSWELSFALAGKAKAKKEVSKETKIKAPNIFQNALKNVLKLTDMEVLEEKSIGKKDVVLNGPSALICEVPNINELKELNIKVMNGTFFENKKILVVCLNEKTANEYHHKLNIFNKEYDGKLVIKQITDDDRLFDNTVDIYVTEIENCFGNIKLLSEIDTIIIEDYDEILLNKLELLRAFGSIVKMGNPNMSYIILTYMLQGIEATIKSLLLVNNISFYCPSTKYASKNIELNVWDKNDKYITETVFGKQVSNLGSMVPLSLLSVKWYPDRILLISENEPLDFELNELNAMRTLSERNVDNIELKILSEKAKTSTRERYFSNVRKNWIITDDKYNLYEKIYKLSLINGNCNNLNIVSEQYMLRDFMIDTYKLNKTRLKSFLPYVPYEVNSGKVVLYNLLLQLTNFGVKETVIINILNENGFNMNVAKGNNIKLIADNLNKFIKNEFNIDVDLYSYITIQEMREKYIFDVSKKKYIEEEKNYLLDEAALKLFPNEIFGRISFVKDGFELDVEKEYAYNFYQKYLPGQKHFLDGYVYEIKHTIETEDGVNAVVDLSTNYDNHTYRQDRKVSIVKEFVSKASKFNKYANLAIKYEMGNMDYQIKTDGYFEFKDGISMIPGTYRYVGLDEKDSLKTVRNHVNADVMKLEFIMSPNLKKGLPVVPIDEIGEKLAFLISEALVSLLGENSKYIQVKSVKDNFKDTLFDETWVQPIEIPGHIAENVEIYILEDTQIERGLIDMIYKNMDNILKIIHEYLEWVFTEDDKLTTTRERFLIGVDPSETSLMKYKRVFNILKHAIME